MKKALSTLLILSLLMTCITAFASVETEDWLVSLSNKAIKSMLNKNGYKGWKLYQPRSRETGINTSSNSFLKTINLYAVVATDPASASRKAKTNQHFPLADCCSIPVFLQDSFSGIPN